jgi:hypothetical protein
MNPALPKLSTTIGELAHVLYEEALLELKDERLAEDVSAQLLSQILRQKTSRR